MRAISDSQNTCYYELLRSIKGEVSSKRASCFNDHKDIYCLVLAISYHDLHKRKFVDTPHSRDSCFNDHYIATRALVLHGLHKLDYTVPVCPTVQFLGY